MRKSLPPIMWPRARTHQRLTSACWWFAQADQKYAYYLSMEFLQGRALLNAVENLEMADEVRAALAKVRPKRAL